jgi:gamma-glutamyl:cysteine ligase YbdK (ATP-grasp superfamily)
MNQMEAREWIQRYKAKILQLGRRKAFAWWLNTLQEITKKRGAEAAEDLRQRMNAEKEKND